jgi:hypothetical protein
VTMPMTYGGLVDRLVAIGMLPAERAHDALPTWATVDEVLESEDVPSLLEDLGVAVSVHGEDVDDLEESYRHILERAAALSGGSVVVTDVALDLDGPAEERLTFRRNGAPVTWWEEHSAPDYLDHMAVLEQIADLAPGGEDPRAFYGLLKGEVCADDYYLLLTPDQAAALRDDLDLDLQQL